MNTPRRGRRKNSGAHLPYTTRPVPVIQSVYAEPKGRYRSGHRRWWEAREAYAKAPVNVDEEAHAGRLEDMLMYVTIDNPPDAPRAQTVAKRDRIPFPVALAVVLSVWFIGMSIAVLVLA